MLLHAPQSKQICRLVRYKPALSYQKAESEYKYGRHKVGYLQSHIQPSIGNLVVRRSRFFIVYYFAYLCTYLVRQQLKDQLLTALSSLLLLSCVIYLFLVFVFPSGCSHHYLMYQYSQYTCIKIIHHNSWVKVHLLVSLHCSQAIYFKVNQVSVFKQH